MNEQTDSSFTNHMAVLVRLADFMHLQTVVAWCQRRCPCPQWQWALLPASFDRPQISTV